MNAKNDIQNLEDIQLLVDSFYATVRSNDLLGPIFNERIGDRWAEHLQKMYRFWQTILLEDHTYFGSPFPPHAQLPVDQIHFDTWLQLWHGTIDQYFQGKKADEAKWRGDKMAAMFLYKITYYRDNNATPLV
ncbi:group III truncated hemoglobin [Niabella yanshanensis]|uniref:Group III truncated hemoglobin n=1 Tax=Niabella yanshanensis TaxID=577386 RepID=A0ABZ0WAP8_9BACT|nr:group III truncated hemoglobin [Niabella yanshanensis]WQD40231.1 group III truncated hemoglobin [Niabella yanshanensis]